jgi:hypothetical protein
LRPRCRCVARFGHLDMSAQAEVPSARRSDTPRYFQGQARSTPGE